MSEIKPAWVDGEPVCSMDCPKWINLPPETCRVLGKFVDADEDDRFDEATPCVPALRQQRDDYKRERDAARVSLCDHLAKAWQHRGSRTTPERCAELRGWSYLYEEEQGESGEE